MTKLKSKKMTKSTIAIIVMAIVMVAMMAFGGTYAYFTATATGGSRKFTTGTIRLGFDTPVKFELPEDAMILPGDVIVKDAIVLNTDGATAESYIAVNFEIDMEIVNPYDEETEADKFAAEELRIAAIKTALKNDGLGAALNTTGSYTVMEDADSDPGTPDVEVTKDYIIDGVNLADPEDAESEKAVKWVAYSYTEDGASEETVTNVYVLCDKVTGLPVAVPAGLDIVLADAVDLDGDTVNTTDDIASIWISKDLEDDWSQSLIDENGNYVYQDENDELVYVKVDGEGNVVEGEYVDAEGNDYTITEDTVLSLIPATSSVKGYMGVPVTVTIGARAVQAKNFTKTVDAVVEELYNDVYYVAPTQP
ncbi:MAG: hypothetical protein E7374_01825 [Clostridiales bacterium]|nr:hypothetical protein [Clostridiales bacterium]